MSLDADLERLADATAETWPEFGYSGQLEAAIRELYRAHLKFPPFWTPDERDEFIAENADMHAGLLQTQLDDVIDIVIDRYQRQHGVHPHSDDATALITADQKAAVCELKDWIDFLSEELAQLTIHTAGRSVASMAGCSPASRRSQATIRREAPYSAE